MTFDLRGKRVFVAGHRGMIGSAIVRRLASEDCEILMVSRSELDLLDQAGVRRWMAEHRPDAVVMAAAKVAGLKLCQAYRRQYGVDYISAMPTNLYGPGDNFDLTSSHVVPALMRKAHEVKRSGEKTLDVWGSGRPMREFLHVDDAADALVWLLKDYAGDSHVNVGSGEDIGIADLARTMLSVVGVESRIAFDATKPDGTPRKLMDVSRLFATGWRPRYSLRRGLEQTYAWFLGHVDKGDVRLGTA